MEEKIEEKAAAVSNPSKRMASFSVVAVRKMAKDVINTKDKKRGITVKAGTLLSIAASKLLEQICKEAADRVKDSDQKVISKQLLIDICLKIPRYRFAVSSMKMNEIQQYLSPSTELSRRIANSMTNIQFPLAVPFVAPNPPGRAGTSEEGALFREVENTNHIISSLSMSISAYMNTVPAFFKNPKQ